MAYDRNNVFAKILRGEIPANKVYEDDEVLAFKDIAPKAPVHVLVIPKAPYVSLDDFATDASALEIGGFFKKVGDVARRLGLAENGYRLIANIGSHGGQEVPHFHVHILGGHAIGPMVVERK
jgi:diadenosine tetraphosphate (Ap4A) HIT family hydrolase